jgi:hypothetical protein
MKECHSLFSKGAMWEWHFFFAKEQELSGTLKKRERLTHCHLAFLL